MNKTEAVWAEHLKFAQVNGEVEWFMFEPFKLKLADKTYYSPDFLVMLPDGTLEVHEIKGTSKGKPFIEDDAAVKIKVAARLFPFKFKLLWIVKDAGWSWREYS
jgi:hypothetical protein